MQPPAPTIPAVISQHAEEASFQWIRRDAAVHAPHYRLEDLVKLDSVVVAHLDGLTIAGEDGWNTVVDELAWEEPGEVFVAAFLAIASGDADRIEQVLAVAEKDAELARGAISALGWLGVEQSGPAIRMLLESSEVARRCIGIAGAAVLGLDPDQMVPNTLAAALAEDDPMMRSRALLAVGELGRRDLSSHLKSGMSHEDARVKFAAAWSGGLIGEGLAPGVLRVLAEDGQIYSEAAADLAARVTPAEHAVGWVRSLKDPRIRMKAAGALGDPALAEEIVAVFSDDDHSRVAGEALAMITGVDLAYDDLDRDQPDVMGSGPSELPDDDNVALDDDEDLPFADPALLSIWWNEHRGAYQPGTRYLLGLPIDVSTVHTALARGYQRQRSAAALELAIRQPGEAMMNVRARGDRQVAALGLRPGYEYDR